MLFKKKPTPEPQRRRPITQNVQSRQAVFSYHAYRSVRPDDPSPERDMGKADEGLVAARRKRHISLWHNARVIGVTLGVLLFFALDTILSSTPKVMATGDDSGQIFLRSMSVYADAAHKLLASSALDRNKVTIDTDRVSASLLHQFPELAAVSMSLPIIGSQPVVYVQPATPKLVLATQGDGSFVLDGSGRALMNSAQVANLAHLQLPTVTDQSGLKLQVGQTALTAGNVAFIAEVAGQLKAKGVAVASMTLPVASSELDVHFSGAPYYAKFNLAAADARQEIGTLLAAQQYLKSNGQTPATYIDVRVPGRAYYK